MSGHFTHHATLGEIIFLSLMTLMIGSVLLWSLVISMRARRWTKTGDRLSATAKATITSIRIFPPAEILVDFQFTDAQGKTRSCTHTINDMFEFKDFSYKAGDVVDVIYNREDGSLNYLKGYDRDFRRNNTNVFSMLLAVAAFAYIVFKMLQSP